MHRRRLTRRQTVQAGAAALAAGFLRPVPALAAPAALFELALDGEFGDASASAAGWRTTRALNAPRRFDLIGLRWAEAPQLQAQVRTRRRGGGWSSWTSLHAGGGHAPDGERPPGTEPAYTGAADVFQLRLRGSVRGLRARFVRAQPTARVARRLAARGSARAHASARGQAAQAGQPPTIITRAEWGAETVPPRAPAAYGQVELAFVHHTATANDYSPAESAGIVLGICRYHRDSNGWNDIGYNFLVDKYGQVFEGRAGGIYQPVIGAQAQGYNSVSTGIACLGDFTSIAQSPAALEALAGLIGWKLTLHGVPTQGQVTVTSAGGPTNRFKSGTPVTYERISGHRDGDNTSCPGDQLYAQLPALRMRAGAHATSVSALTLRVASTRVRFPAVSQASGVLRFADAGPSAGLELGLEFRAESSAAWEAVGTTRCGTDGAWSAQLALPRSGDLRAVWRGDATRGALVSRAASVIVMSQLSLRLSSTRLKAGRVLRVRGEVAPIPEPAGVALTLERRRRSRWVRVRRRSLRVADGSYYVRLRLPVPGLYRVTISAPGVTERRLARATT